MQPGDRIAHFEILGLVGRGGMGEVYQARDPRLGRDVAIKVLPARFASDPDRLRRFELEARAVAALDHPNILAIHDVGSHEGAPYLVTELLEGESLRERLRGGAIPVRKAVEMGVQIAHGLAAAHEKGIVHRDLKPANGFVTKDGHVKILDFGIAKLTRPDPGPQGTTITPEPSTDAGALVGTAGYMSPEQVRGLPVDHRTDIFSFGCLLYELLSGRSPFHRETTAETMTAILHDDPPPLARIGREIPRVLDGIVGRCLEKRPENRFQSARDLAFDLEVQGRAPEWGTGPRPGVVKAPRGKSLWLAASAALAAATLVLVGGTFFGQRWFTAATARCTRLTYRRGIVTRARFAPDGRTVVYSATWDGAPTELFSLRLGNPESTPLGFTYADLLAISSTDQLAIIRNPGSPLRRSHPSLRARTTFAVAPFSGGIPRDLDDTILDADYSPDGRAMAVLRVTQEGSQAEYPIGTVRSTSARWCPRVSPDGARLAFFADNKVAVVDTRRGASDVLAEGIGNGESLAWSPGGDEVWYSDYGNQLRAVSLSGRKRVVYAQTMRLTLQDVAKDGRVLITTWDKRQRNYFRGPGDTTDRELTFLDWTLVRGLSDDGQTLAFCESEEGVGFKCISYLRGTDGSPPMKLGEGAFPRLSLDGRFAVVRNCGENELVVYPVGPGASRRVPISGVDVRLPALLPDDTTICFSGNEPPHGERLWLTDLAGSRPRPLTPEGTEHSADITGDGRYGVVKLDGVHWLYPLPSGEPRRMNGVLAGEWVAAVAADGAFAFVYFREEVPTKVYKVDLRTGDRVLFREISLSDRAGASLQTPPLLNMTSDGRSYNYSFDQTLGELYLIEGLR